MAQNFISKLGKLITGLPIIRNIPGFNTLPPEITQHYIRFYKLGNITYTFGVAIHGTWISLFWFLGLTTLSYINIGSAFIYIICIIINRRGYHYTASYLMITEIIVHQVFAVKMLGWNAGFQYYIIVVGLLPFMMPQGKWVLKIISAIFLLITYILMDYYLSPVPTLYQIPPGFFNFFRISNISFSIITLDLAGAYYTVAMHQTENALEQKTAELVESERKATLGKIATEMAHEIQNPLNFVNNFAALNQELLQEMEKELVAGTDKNEIKFLMENLLTNSEKIKINGQRVSKIVALLQEQVNKL